MDLGYMKPSKIFYHPDRIAAYLNETEIEPISIKIYLTEQCNLACSYCVYKQRLSSKEMALPIALAVVERIKELGTKSIVFTGGEPSLYEHIEKVAIHAREKGLDVGLITNGVIYTPIKHYTWARYSVDTANKNTYKKIKGKDKLDAVKETITRAIQEKKETGAETTIGIQMVVSTDNYREILEFAEAYTSMGADYCSIRPDEVRPYSPSEMECIMEQLKIIDTRKFATPILIDKTKWAEAKRGHKKNYTGCPGAKFIGAVGVNGSMYICCTWMKSQKAKYGSLVIEGRKILKRRDKILEKFNYSHCPIGCQGSLINKALTELDRANHRNFI